MAYGFPTESNFTPRIKYDAKAGRAFRVDREPDASGKYASRDVDITDKFLVLINRASARKGYVNFSTFDERTVPLSHDLPTRPAGQDAQGKPSWKPTLKFRCKLAPEAGGDVREFATSAMCVMDALQPITDGWDQDPKGKDPDLCPVLKLAGVTPVKTGFGTNYVPSFQVVGWKPCPADLALPMEPDDGEDAPPEDWEPTPGTDKDDLPF